MENEQIIPEQSSVSAAEKAQKAAFDKKELANFYKDSLPKMVKTFFSEPISGTYALLSQKSDKNYFNSLVLMVSTAILYILLPYSMLGDSRSYIGFSPMFKIGITVIVLMLVIALFVFGIKSISGKPVFKNELLTGALCGIPLSLLIVFIFIIQLFSKDFSINNFGRESIESLQSFGTIVGLAILYILLMLINIVQQSLKSGGTKNALAWYLSPAGIILSFYVSYKIGAALL